MITLILYYLCIVNSGYFKVHTKGPSNFFGHAEQGGNSADGGVEEEDLFADLPVQVS